MKRWILAAITALLTGCASVDLTLQQTQTNTQGVSNMIAGRTFSMLPYRQSDIIKRQFDFRSVDLNYWVQYYLQQGYVIFDPAAAANGSMGFLDSATVAKYLVCWKSLSPKVLATVETGTAQAGAENTTTSIKFASTASATDDYYKGCVIRLTGGVGSGCICYCSAYNGTSKKATVVKAWAGGITPNNTTTYEVGGYDIIDLADITHNTDVVFLGVKLNAYNQVEPASYNTTGIFTNMPYFSIKFDNAGSERDVLHKLTFLYSYFKFVQNSASNLVNANFINNYMCLEAAVYNIKTSIIINNCIVESGGLSYITIVGNEKYENNYFQGSGLIYLGPIGATGSFKNNYIVSEGFYLLLQAGAYVSSNMIGNYCKTLYVDSTITSDGIITIYTDSKGNQAGSVNSSFIFKVVPRNTTINTPNGSVLNPLGVTAITTPLRTEVGGIVLDWAAIDFTDFETLDAEVAPEYVTNNADYFNTGNNLYYNLNFLNNYLCPDELKKFSTDYLFIVHRTDFEASLITAQKYIKNLQLYNEVGATTEYTYDNDENFLIAATDTLGNRVFFIWYHNTLCATYLSEVMDGVVYTIDKCFQLWQGETWQGLRSIWSNVTDSPMEGSIRFNNWDNEIVYKG